MAENDLMSAAFPTLNEAQIAQLSRLAGAPRLYRDGETLFTVGDRDFKFFIVKSGEVEIVDRSGDEPRTVTVHRQGGFTGEVTLLTGTPSLTSGIARGDCELYELSAETLRQVLN